MCRTALFNKYRTRVWRIVFCMAYILTLPSLTYANPSTSAIDPWKIVVETPLKGDYYGITSANGQIGIVSSRKPLKADNLIIGGLYDIYGSSGGNSFFPNINPLDVDIKVDGTMCSLQTIDDYTQFFDMRTAQFGGRFVIKDKVSVEYTICALRHLPFAYMTDVRIEALSDCEIVVSNRHRAPECLQDVAQSFRRIDNKANYTITNYPHYELMTTTALSPTGRYQLAASTAFLFPENTSGGVETEMVHRTDEGAKSHRMEWTKRIKAGERVHFALVGNSMASNFFPDVRNEVERLTVYLMLEGYDRTITRHNSAWKALWNSRIDVEGDEQACQDIHNMLYHLYAFHRKDNGLNTSPMGLSGLGYCGHSFWDSETWVFPALALMHPDLAAEMINYRYKHLDAAKKNAYIHGFEGALYPWESAHTGQEETAPHNMYPATEHHVTGDIAIAAWQYYLLTQDKQWLRETGYPIIEQTAQFWCSRVDKQSDNTYAIRNLIGADEWSQNKQGGKQVDNNAYTIGVAKKNLQCAIKAAKVLGLNAPDEWQKTADGLQWQYMNNGVIREHDTYDGEIIKQADVALLAYPLNLMTNRGDILRNIAYYDDKVPLKRTPAMTNSIYSVIYARLGCADTAITYFFDSYLPNLNPPFRVMAEFNGGTNPYFLTGTAGTLQALLFGFAGLDWTDDGIKQVYKPCLPKQWKALTITRNGKKMQINNK